MQLLAEEGEDWAVFEAFRGQLPTAEQVQRLDGCVITGSLSDAFGDEPWVQCLRQLVLELLEARTRLLVSGAGDIGVVVRPCWRALGVWCWNGGA